MAKGIEIGIASETKAFKQGVEIGMIEPVEKALDALDELGRNRGPDQLERGLADAQDRTKNLQRDTREAADNIERQYKSAYRSMALDADDGFDRSKDAARNFKEEALQNFAETASSFDGSMNDIASAAQSTLGGASVAVGGLAGAALGTIAVVGGAVLERINQDTEAAEERVQAMYDSFVESGLNYLTQEQALNALSEITGDPNRIKEIEQQAERLGLPIQTVLAAQVQKGEERNEVLRVANELLAESNAQLEAGTYTDGDRLTALEGIVGEYQKLNGEQDTALRGAELYRAAAETITGQQILTNEEIQIQNRLLAETPNRIPVSLVPDTTELDRQLAKPRNITVGVIGRNGRIAV